MRGSYGLDKLNWAMLITGGVFTILALVFASSANPVLYWVFFGISCVFLVLVCLRMFSKNKAKRAQETRSFEAFFAKLKKTLIPSAATIEEHKNYRFFACSQCLQRLRVPRGKGKIRITCVRCGHKFVKRT